MNVFDRAIFMRPGRVFGYRLQPFSAFHATCLILVGSPLIDGGDAPTWADIACAVLICRSRKRDGLRKVLRFHNSRIVRGLWWLRIRLSRRLTNHVKIANHISAYFDFPEVATPLSKDAGSGSCKSGAPWPYFVVSIIWQATGTDLEQLWDMPLIELCCHKAIHDEVNGGSEIVTGLLEERERNREKANGSQD